MDEIEKIADSEETTAIKNKVEELEKSLDSISKNSESIKTKINELSTALDQLSDSMNMEEVKTNYDKVTTLLLAVPVGDTLSLDAIPVLAVEADSEYEWDIIPTVTSESLGMGEVAEVEYLSENTLTNILFNQTYQATASRKRTFEYFFCIKWRMLV